MTCRTSNTNEKQKYHTVGKMKYP